MRRTTIVLIIVAITATIAIFARLGPDQTTGGPQ